MKYDNFRKISSDEIKEHVDANAFYLLEQQLSQFKPGSNNWVIAGLCPFHNDTTEGSFKINTETGQFICFSCGAKGGDIIAFTMKRYDLWFLDALRKIRQEWGVR
jgi:DNA primase